MCVCVCVCRTSLSSEIKNERSVDCVRGLENTVLVSYIDGQWTILKFPAGHFRCVSGVHLCSVLRTGVEISVVFQRDVIVSNHSLCK